MIDSGRGRGKPANDPPPVSGEPTAAAAGPIRAAGYLAALGRILGRTVTTDRPKDPKDYHPEDDEPWTVLDD